MTTKKRFVLDKLAKLPGIANYGPHRVVSTARLAGCDAIVGEIGGAPPSNARSWHNSGHGAAAAKIRSPFLTFNINTGSAVRDANTLVALAETT